MIAIVVTVALTCAPFATDGDTIRCGDEKIRLLGIDAPEMEGRCRAGRVCQPGDPRASRDNLALALKHGPYSIKRVGKDRYGRTLALVSAAGQDLSCLQVTTGNAAYIQKWDNKSALKEICNVG